MIDWYQSPEEAAAAGCEFELAIRSDGRWKAYPECYASPTMDRGDWGEEVTGLRDSGQGLEGAVFGVREIGQAEVLLVL